jgi:type II secretory pathway component HofQ
VNLFLFESSIRDALSEISLQTGVNIIPDSTVSGRVTVDLQDVPLEQALRIILIGGGYSFRKIDDFYFVGQPSLTLPSPCVPFWNTRKRPLWL